MKIYALILDLLYFHNKKAFKVSISAALAQPVKTKQIMLESSDGSCIRKALQSTFAVTRLRPVWESLQWFKTSDLVACFGHFQSALMLQVVRFGSKNSKISITEGLFWTFPQRVIEKAEKQAEQSQEKMPELKRRKRADLFNQKQYQKEDTGLSVYGAKSSKKSKKNSETDLKDLSLTEITNIKPNL